MITTPQGYEIVTKSKYEGTVEQAISNGFEDAIKDKGKECDYEFKINTNKGRKFILCEVKIDNGYFFSIHYPVNDKPKTEDIERQAYKFLSEKL